MRLKRLAVIPVLGVALLAAGCGGEEDVSTPATLTPTPAGSAPSASLAPTATRTPEPSPTPTPPPSPTPEPTQTPTPTRTATPEPTFSPPPVILPTVPVPTLPPPGQSEVTVEDKLDAVGLRINVLRELSTERPIDREIVSRSAMATKLQGLFDEDLEEFETTQQLYSTLGVVLRGTDLYGLVLALYSEGVIGLFDEDVEKLLVVQESEEFGPAEVRTYAHEYVHGLQQHHYDLSAIQDRLEERSNSDAGLAYAALREGDATIAEFLYVNQHMNPEEAEASLAEPSEALIEAFLSAPHLMQRTYLFAYQEGAVFTATLYRNEGWGGVDAGWANLPQSTEQILHPEKYAEGDLPIEVAVPDVLELLGEGWTEVTQDTLGEFFLQAYLETDFDVSKAAAAAAGWGGDRFTLLSNASGENVMVLPIVWDTENDAQEFFDTFVEFTAARTQGQWEPDVEGEASPQRMTLGDQTIFVSLDGANTLNIFAPDQDILDTVVAGLQGEEPPAQQSTTTDSGG